MDPGAIERCAFPRVLPTLLRLWDSGRDPDDTRPTPSVWFGHPSSPGSTGERARESQLHRRTMRFRTSQATRSVGVATSTTKCDASIGSNAQRMAVQWTGGEADS